MMAFQRGFSFRGSTICLSVMLISLAGAYTSFWVGQRFGIENSVKSVSGFLEFTAFPWLTICSCVVSLGYLVVNRRIQHVVEFAISMAFLIWMLTVPTD